MTIAFSVSLNASIMNFKAKPVIYISNSLFGFGTVFIQNPINNSETELK